jgi:hypothetical protein
MASPSRRARHVEPFEPIEDDVEVRGAAVQSIVEGVPDAFTANASQYLAEQGIEDIDPDEWYTQQAYLDAYQRIVEDIGESTLRRIGKSTPENAEWPPGIDTPLDALRSIDDAYHMNHRGGEIGYYDAEADGDGAIVYCKTPYPCAYDEALVKGTAEQFTDAYVTVTEVGDECRAEGGDECAYRVEW